MDILVQQGSVTEVQTPLLAVNLFEGVTVPGGATGAVDGALGGLISRLIAEGEIKGQLDEVALLHTQGRLPAARVAVVGLGPREKFDLDVIRRVSGSLLKRAQELSITSFHTIVHGAGIAGFPATDCVQAIVEGTLLASYGYRQFKSEKQPPSVERVTFIERDAGKVPSIEEGIGLGRVYAGATTTARDLAAGPPNLVTPEYVAERAQELADRYGMRCELLGPEEMESLGMGAILAVGKGSDHPPCMALLRYEGDPGSQRLLGIVGKGITFDSGGISIKPAQDMDRMKYDKAGAAAVLGTMQGLAELEVKANVLGVIAAAENLPSGRAYRPGDIVRASNGKSIEVISTDAEGRLVLADALAHAARQGADPLVDIATLTGGVVVALGTGGAGVMGNDDALLQQLREAGDRTGERLWPLPIWEDYLWEQVRSDFADIKNSGGRYGSSPIGGLFLSQFVGNAKWAHLDIAGTAWVGSDQPSLPKSYIPKGPTGFGARLLLDFIRRRAEG
ncbi:MAG: leucyl aminopeptidase [Sphingomonadaceae bacterium]